MGMDAVKAAKTQFQHAQLLEHRAPMFPPEQRIDNGVHLQQPITQPTPCKVLLPRPKKKTHLGGLSFSPELLTKRFNRGNQHKLLPLRERVVMNSSLPDSLKMESLHRLDEVDARERIGPTHQKGAAQQQIEEEEEELEEGQTSKYAILPGGFRAGQAVVARQDLYCEGPDQLTARYMDKAVVIGRSRGADTNRISVQFEARRDGGTLHVNVLPEEILSAENGKLMQLLDGKEPGGSALLQLQRQKAKVEGLQLLTQPERHFTTEVAKTSSSWTRSPGLKSAGSLHRKRSQSPPRQQERLLLDTPGSRALRDSRSLPSLLRM